jgi:UDP-N-acetylmuramoyl-tripeptide--D-alanyl-D-alanine ligase
MLTLADILEALTGEKIQSPSLYISEATIDSRQAIPASMFVALPGEKTDGHDYVDQAFQRGAHLALVQKDLSAQFNTLDIRGWSLMEDFTIPDEPFCLLVDDSLKALQEIARFWRNKLNLRVIGITGSVGKSTTKELVAEVLGQRYHTFKNPGNLNNEIGLPLSLLRLGPGHECAVLEMGFYVPGEIAFLCELAQPHVGVITNIGTVHAERAGSQEVIAAGKSELIQSLPRTPHGVAVLNYDDPWVRPMADITKASILFYGLDSRANLWADRVNGLGLEGIRFRLHFRKETLHLRVPLIGRHSVHTVLRASAVGLIEGLSWQEIISGLQWGRSQLRLVAVRTETGAFILDDSYNASPESTLAALNLLGELDGRKIAVLGDMLELGQYERQGHEMVGVRAAEVCSELITIGEKGKMIAESALDSGLSSRKIYSFEQTPEVIDFLRSHLNEGDIVLIKGSHGLRMDRIVSALEAGS